MDESQALLEEEIVQTKEEEIVNDTPAIISEADDSACVIVSGKVVEQLPEDLFIPPDALRVFLDAFTGPLDLLLYLIKKQNIDILDIPMLKITTQYISYIDLMQELRLELAADYLVMAATLAEIKSRLLLPRSEELEEDEEDPRAELIRRLQEYERIKIAAENLEEIPRLYRDTRLAKISVESIQKESVPEVSLQELAVCFANILSRTNLKNSHMVKKEVLSVRERMSTILGAVDDENFVPFSDFFTLEESRMGVLVTFLAILELTKEGLLELVQGEAFGMIRVKAVSACQS